MFTLLRNNNDTELQSNFFSFDEENQEIIPINNTERSYLGRQEEINILKRLKRRYENNKAFESHLQAYILKSIGRNTNINSALSIEGQDIEWIGNEVSCGVGMQRIDICISVKLGEQERKIIPIELKAVEVSINNLTQIKRYIDWLKQYYIPNRISDIKTFLICKKKEDKTTEEFRNIINSSKANVLIFPF